VTQHIPPDVLAEIDQTAEVQIESRSPSVQQIPPVTIWVVVLENRDVYVRSYRGPKGRWYQALMQHPSGVLRVGQREVPFRAVHVDDPQLVASVSDAFRHKYEQRWPNETAAMLRDEVLSNTLELQPAT
jgi:hypothetical protein